MALLRSKSTPWFALFSGLSLTLLVVLIFLFFEDGAFSLELISLQMSLALVGAVILLSASYSGKREKGNHTETWLLIAAYSLFTFSFSYLYSDYILLDGGSLLWIGASLLPLWLWVAPILVNAYFGIFTRRGQPPLRKEYENLRNAPVTLKWLCLAAIVVTALAWWYLAKAWFDPYYTYDDGLLNASAGPLMVSSTLLFAVGLAWIVQLTPFPDSGRSATLLMQAILAAIGFLVAFLALPTGWPGVLVVQATLAVNAVLMGYMAGPVAHVSVRFLPRQSHFARGEADTMEGA